MAGDIGPAVGYGRSMGVGVAPMLPLALIVLAGCVSSDTVVQEPEQVERSSTRTIELAGAEAGLHLPPEATDAAPVVVMLHGTEGDRTRLDPLASAVAAGGALVYVPPWPVIDQVAAYPEDEGGEPLRRQSEAVVCTLREIRRTTSQLGGDPENITVVGHSGGGWIGARVALVDEPPWPGIDCDAEIDHRPQRFIGLAGDYWGIYQYGRHPRYAPYDLLAIEPTNIDLETWVLFGHNDDSVWFDASRQLVHHAHSAGIATRLITGDWDHVAPLDPEGPAGRYTAELISAVVHEEADESRTPDDTAATLVLASEGGCTYSGPSTWPLDEELVLRVENRQDADASFGLVSVRPDVDLSDAQLLENDDETNPYDFDWRDRASFFRLEPDATQVVPFVFAEGDQRFVLYCQPGSEAEPPWANRVLPAGVLTPDGWQQ
jgi:pimeloyl-ACP methyl ester carboxylesterase